MNKKEIKFLNTESIKKEIETYEEKDFKLGEYIYMGMARLDNQTVCISVAYKIDYCIKKAGQFINLKGGEKINFYKINKVKVGATAACVSFMGK